MMETSSGTDVASGFLNEKSYSMRAGTSAKYIGRTSSAAE